MAERSLEVEGESEDIFEVEDEDEGALMEAYSSEEEVCKDSLATDHDVLSGAAIMKKEPKCLLVNLAANMDEVEEEVTYQGEKTTTIELLSTRLNLVETMSIRMPKPKSSKKAAIEDHDAAQNKTLQSVMKSLLRMYAPYAKFQAQANLKSQENLLQAQGTFRLLCSSSLL